MAAPVLDVAAYQAMVFPSPPCWQLVTHVYRNVLGEEPDQVQTVSEAMRLAARTYRLELFKSRDGMEQLAQPRDFAIVLMWRTSSKRQLHCGIYYGGKVLHATESATLYQDMGTLRDTYPLMEFWATP